MTQALIDFADVCANRHGGAETSVEANKRTSKEADRLLILACITSRPRTLDEVSEIFNRPPNALSGRFSELAASGEIEKTGEMRKTRSGCNAAVWRIKA